MATRKLVRKLARKMTRKIGQEAEAFETWTANALSISCYAPAVNPVLLPLAAAPVFACHAPDVNPVLLPGTASAVIASNAPAVNPFLEPGLANAASIACYAPEINPSSGSSLTYIGNHSGTTNGSGNITFSGASLGSGTSNKRIVITISNNATGITIAGTAAAQDGTALSNANCFSAATNSTTGDIAITGSAINSTVSVSVYELIGGTGVPTYTDRTLNSGSTITITLSTDDGVIYQDWTQTAELPVTWSGGPTKDIDSDAGSGYYVSNAHYLAASGGSVVAGASNNFGVAGGAGWRYSLS